MPNRESGTVLINRNYEINSNRNHPVLERQIDKMVYALYGLTPEEIAIIERRK